VNKINLGQTIAILANLGVIAGIVFLALELQQNNSELASQSRMNFYQMRSDLDNQFIENVGGVGDLLSKARQGEPLSGYDTARLNARNRLILDTLEFMYQEEPRTLENSSGWMRRMLETSPNMPQAWEQNRERYGSDFVQLIDPMIVSAAAQERN